MGAFSVQFEIGDQSGQRWQGLEGLVDTGSTYTWVPRDTLEGLAVEPRLTREFETADGRIISRELAVVQVRLDAQTLPTLVVFADPGDSVLLGVVTLEEFGLGVDTVNRKLVPVRGLAMRRHALP
jgi:predicted aspartyl protease